MQVISRKQRVDKISLMYSKSFSGKEVTTNNRKCFFAGDMYIGLGKSRFATVVTS